MKFQKGDRVRVKLNSRCKGGMYANKVGVVDKVGIVESVGRKLHYPYRIKLDDGHTMVFTGNELEKEE